MNAKRRMILLAFALELFTSQPLAFGALLLAFVVVIIGTRGCVRTAHTAIEWTGSLARPRSRIKPELREQDARRNFDQKSIG